MCQHGDKYDIPTYMGKYLKVGMFFVKKSLGGECEHGDIVLSLQHGEVLQSIPELRKKFRKHGDDLSILLQTWGSILKFEIFVLKLAECVSTWG